MHEVLRVRPLPRLVILGPNLYASPALSGFSTATLERAQAACGDVLQAALCRRHLPDSRMVVRSDAHEGLAARHQLLHTLVIVPS